MLFQALILLHVCSAAVALLSGFTAMAFRKGAGSHAVAGSIFVVSMLSMSGLGAYMAAFMKPNNGNVLGGALSFYLVATGWMAARRRDRNVGPFDFSALFVALAIGIAGVTWGLQAVSSPTGLKDGYRPGLYFVFASIALLFAAADVRMVIRGGFSGAQRIARHLWRMCLALLFATVSLYPGQARLFPASWRATNFLFVPHVLLIGAMLFGLYRVSARKRLRQPKVIKARHTETVITRIGIPRQTEVTL
jgi:hypothetical protein